MENDYTIKRISRDNVKDIVYLMKSVHGTSKSEDFYHNKLNTIYADAQYIGYFAYSDEGEPAAFYVVYPTLLSNGEKEFIGAQSGDTITNPKHQRKGLFKRLANLTYILAAKNNIEVIFGFPNNNSAFAFFNRLGWVETSKFQYVSLEFKNLNLYNILHKFFALRFMYKMYYGIVKLMYQTTPFNMNETSLTKSIVSRKKEYYSYKKNFSDTHFIQVNNFVFWVKLDNGIVIGDVARFEVNTENQTNFFASVKKLASLMGVKNVRIFFNRDSFLKEVFINHNTKEAELFCGHKALVEKKFSFLYSYSDLDTF